MSSQSQSGPTPTTSAPAQGGVALSPSPEKLQQAFDNGIWYALSLWPALHVATQNNWGGPDSSDKKDWFAGAVSDLFASRPDTDNEELEVFLLQIMQDEFDCNVEDDSECEVARNILGLKKNLAGEEGTAEDRLDAFKQLEQRYKNRGQLKTSIQIIDNGPNEEAEWDDDEGDGDEEMNMNAANDFVPNLVPAIIREKEEPEVDEEGFTKVAGRRKGK